jgi:TPR repeat protein
MICSGCIHAVDKMKGDSKCPFCRAPVPRSDEDLIERVMKRVEMDDAEAIRSFGCFYAEGIYGLPQNYEKAVELWHRAGKLGSVESYHNIGNAYYFGRGVERDEKKAKHYYELAAIGGYVSARYNLGIVVEENAGKMRIALNHHMVAAGCGHDKSLEVIREFYMNGHATKDDYAKALRAHQKYIDGIKSAQRDEAAAYDNDEYRYR